MTRVLKSVAVFCGSNTGLGDGYIEAAKALGQAIGEQNLTLVYGGTHKGLMGVLADAAIAAGGSVHGVITQRLAERGHQHPNLNVLEIVDGMRARKARMADLADAFIALPGGLGTLEEFMEVWTLNQLGDIEKPAGLFDAQGYYQPFMNFINHMIEQRFLPPAHRESIVVEGDAGRLLDGLAAYQKVDVPKWM